MQGTYFCPSPSPDGQKKKILCVSVVKNITANTQPELRKGTLFLHFGFLICLKGRFGPAEL
jgi:hypothetical protein